MEKQKMLRTRAQNLRKNMTREENKLWYQFLKTYPVQCKRQYQMGSYIVDFYCYRAKIVIELDGSQHYEPGTAEYDNMRTSFLAGQGFEVIRISNRDINERFPYVCDYLDRIIQLKVSKQSRL